MRVLFIVDPQNDFVDPKGSLYVKGAERAIDNICEFIKNEQIDRIIVSQDTHQHYHIGHSEYWRGNPTPGTQIKIPEDIDSGRYLPRSSDLTRIKELNSGKTITIWPHHCIEGSWGQAFPDRLVEALNIWSSRKLQNYEVYTKGKYPHNEAYSLLDDYTPNFLGTTELLVCGFCKDICVYETLKAIIQTRILPKIRENMITVLDTCTLPYGPDDDSLKRKYQELLDIFENSNEFSTNF